MVGAGCARSPASGPGSISGMLPTRAVTAMSHNPLLSDFVQAIHTGGLTNALNRAPVSHRDRPRAPAQLATGKSLNTLLGLPVHPALAGSVYTIDKAQVVCGNIHTGSWPAGPGPGPAELSRRRGCTA